MSSGMSLTCCLESLLLASLLLGVLQELLQAYALGMRRYLRELENLLELAVFALAAVGMAVQADMKILKSEFQILKPYQRPRFS